MPPRSRQAWQSAVPHLRVEVDVPVLTTEDRLSRSNKTVLQAECSLQETMLTQGVGTGHWVSGSSSDSNGVSTTKEKREVLSVFKTLLASCLLLSVKREWMDEYMEK